MALKDILLDLATQGAIKLDDAIQEAYTIYRVNKAAEELYNQNDLNGSLIEQVFNCALSGGMQVSLPNYVGRIRAVRYYFPQLNLKTVDMRPRYAAKFWQSTNMLSWRLKGEKSLQRDITNASLVTLTFRKPLDVNCLVTVAGSTEDADQDSETLILLVGDTTVTTTKSFTEITALSKNVVTSSNADVTDVDGNVLAVIPNNQLKSLYQLVQIINLPNTTNTSNFQPVTDYVELLWKIRFKPFIKVTDEFMCPNYDKAIVWKFLQHKALTLTTPDLTSASSHEAQANKIVKDLADDQDSNLEMSMNFGSNAVYDAFEMINNDTLTRFYPSTFPANGCQTVWP